MMSIAGEEVGLPIRTLDSSQAALRQLDVWRTHPDIRPCMMIVDLNMPTVSGFDLLAFRQEHARTLGFPAYVLSSSSNPQDMAKAKLLGAEGYYVKPNSFPELVELMERIKQSATAHGCNGN